MFYGNDSDGKGYSTRAHLAEVVAILGPPPLDILKRGMWSHEFFAEDGKHNYSINTESTLYLEEAFNNLVTRKMEI